MGKELEFKLSVPKSCPPESILSDPLLLSLCSEPWQERHMVTTYYDSPDRRFSGHFWTLRHRMEGKESIVCVKTPTEDIRTRGEWQVHADTLNDQSVEALILAGAPKELLFLYGLGDVFPVCGADFIRKSVMLTFPDGSKAEFALDRGKLFGKTESICFTEVELELYGGSPEETQKLAEYFCSQYGLREQKKSKFARSRMLK